MPWLRKGEAARALGISPGILARRIDHGKLQVKRENLQVRVHVPQDQMVGADGPSASHTEEHAPPTFRREPEPGGRLARLVTSTLAHEDHASPAADEPDEGHLPTDLKLVGQVAVAVAVAALVVTGWVGWQYRAASQAHVREIQELRDAMTSHSTSSAPAANPLGEVLKAESRQVDRKLTDVQSRWSRELSAVRERLASDAEVMRGMAETDRHASEATTQNIQQRLAEVTATLDAVIRTQDQLTCELEQTVAQRDQALAERALLSEEIGALRLDVQAAGARPTLREVIDQDWDVRPQEGRERSAGPTGREARVSTR